MLSNKEGYLTPAESTNFLDLLNVVIAKSTSDKTKDLATELRASYMFDKGGWKSTGNIDENRKASEEARKRYEKGKGQ